MNGIIKSYLKLFFSKWFETIVMLLFLILFIGTIIGFMAPPLQLQSKVSVVEKGSNLPSYYVYGYSFSDEFAKSAFMDQDETIAVSDTASIDNEFASGVIIDQDKVNKLLDAWKDDNMSQEDIDKYLMRLIKNDINLIDSSIGNAGILRKNLDDDDFILTEAFCNKIIAKHEVHYIANSFISQINDLVPSVNVLSDRKMDFNLELNGKKQYFRLLQSEPHLVNKVQNAFAGVPLKLFAGTMPKDNEVVVTQKLADAGYGIGKSISIFGYQVKVSGIGATYDTLYTGNIGTNNYSAQRLYVNDKTMNNIFAYSPEEQFWGCLELKIYTNSKADVTKLFKLYNGIIDDLQQTETASFFPVANLKIIGIFATIFGAIGVLVFFLCIVFIYFILKRDITSSRVQLGILKAAGYKNSELTFIFVLKTWILITLGTLIGYGMSCFIQPYVASMYKNVTSLTIDSIFATWWFLLILFVVLPLIFSFVSFFLLARDFKNSALILINGNDEKGKRHYILTVLSYLIFPIALCTWIYRLSLEKMRQQKRFFMTRIRHKIISRSIVKFVWVVILIGITALALLGQLVGRSILNTVSYRDYTQYKSDTDLRFVTKNYFRIDRNEEGIVFNRAENDTKDDYTAMHYVDINGSSVAEYEQENVNYDFVDKVSTLFTTVINAFADRDVANNNVGFMTPALMATLTILDVPMDDDMEANIKAISNTYFDDGLIDALAQLKQWKDADNNLTVATAMTGDKLNAYRVSDLFKFGFLVSFASRTMLPNVNDKANWTTNNAVELQKMMLSEEEKVFKYDINATILAKMNSLIYSLSDDYDPLILPNVLFYDSQQDFLNYEMGGYYFDADKNDDNVRLTLYDSSGKYGTPDNVYKWQRDSQINNDEVMKQVNVDKSINVVISKLLAKKRGFSVGDVSSVTTEYDKGKTITVPIKIAGISNALISDENVFIDYDAYFRNVVTNQSDYATEIPYTFNCELLERTNIEINGKITNSEDLIAKARVYEPAISINVGTDSSVFPTLFELKDILKNNRDILSEDAAKQLINDNMHDGTYYQLNTVNYDGIFHTWDSFKIEKILVGQQLGFYMNFLTIFIVLNIILLTVLLFVTINSVIDDLVGVILMFKALGYKTSQINFMICGSYIMASLFIFVVSYFIMQLVYYFATNLIWSKATILINMSWDWQTPLIAFAVMAVVMAVAFSTSIYRVYKLRLTETAAS
jgi:putative ABC transport system permease protein